MFPPQEFTRHGRSSPGPPRVPAAPPGNNQSFGWPLPLPLLQVNFPAHLVDHPLASQQNDFSRLQYSAGLMLPGLPIWPYSQRFHMTNTMQIMTVMICQTWAAPKAKLQSACSKQNSLWCNLSKGWGSPTLVHSTSGRKYGWLGVLKRSIGPLSGDRTVWNNCEINPCTGWQRLQIIRRPLKPGCDWQVSIMPHGFGDTELRWYLRTVQVRFGSQGRR